MNVSLNDAINNIKPIIYDKMIVYRGLLLQHFHCIWVLVWPLYL